MLGAFPIILIAVILYNLIAFGSHAAGHDIASLLNVNFSLPMFSGDRWTISLADLFLLLTLTMLFVEIVRAVRTAQRQVINHALSVLTFLVALAEFLLLKGFGTSTFFFVTLLCLFDMVAGYAFSVVAGRLDEAEPPDEEY